MRYTLVQYEVWQNNFGVVDIDSPVFSHAECQIPALHAWDSGVSDRGREDDIVLDHVVFEDFLESALICGRKNRANRLKRLIDGNEYCDIRCRTLGCAGDLDTREE